MRQPAMLAIVIVTLVCGLADGAKAQGKYWPWCVYYDAWTYNCGFVSLQQCLATAIGAGGACRPNPWGPPAAYSETPRRKKRAR